MCDSATLAQKSYRDFVRKKDGSREKEEPPQNQRNHCEGTSQNERARRARTILPASCLKRQETHHFLAQHFDLCEENLHLHLDCAAPTYRARAGKLRCKLFSFGNTGLYLLPLLQHDTKRRTTRTYTQTHQQRRGDTGERMLRAAEQLLRNVLGRRIMFS